MLSVGAIFGADGIKDAMPFKFGVAIPARIFMRAPNDSSRLVERHFNSITPENEMKPASLQPKEGEFRWDVSDRFVAFGEKNKMKIIGHCLVWHNQTPHWFFVNADGSKADRETLIARMRAHIHAVVGRYKGRIHGWDVVNEAFDDGGRLHPSPWRDGIGEDFIELAFRFAHEADPDAELYYNDFNMFTAGKRRGVVEMVRKFKEKGVRIDAVGLQSHAGLKGPKVEEYEATIEALASVGVKAMITELDVSALPSAWGLTAEITSRHDYDEKYRNRPRHVVGAYGRRLLAERLPGKGTHGLSAVLRSRRTDEAVRKGRMASRAADRRKEVQERQIGFQILRLAVSPRRTG